MPPSRSTSCGHGIGDPAPRPPRRPDTPQGVSGCRGDFSSCADPWKTFGTSDSVQTDASGDDLFCLRR
jgi:hypothetical protein